MGGYSCTAALRLRESATRARPAGSVRAFEHSRVRALMRTSAHSIWAHMQLMARAHPSPFIAWACVVAPSKIDESSDSTVASASTRSSILIIEGRWFSWASSVLVLRDLPKPWKLLRRAQENSNIAFLQCFYVFV